MLIKPKENYLHSHSPRNSSVSHIKSIKCEGKGKGKGKGKSKSKGKVHLRTGHEGPEGE